MPPRSIKHVVPNGRVDVSDVTQIEKHESAAAAALLDDTEVGGQNVMEMWELLLEEDNDDGASTNTIDLVTISELLLGDSTSISCYATKILLTEGVANYCFKELGGKLADQTLYEPRQVHVVENMRGQAEIEAKEASKWDELKQTIDDITNTDEMVMDIERESEEIQAALLSLESLACLANLSPEEVQREEKGDEDRTEAIYKVVCIATAEPFANKLLDMEEDLLTLTSTSVLEVVVSRTAKGGDSPYLTEPYKGLYLSS